MAQSVRMVIRVMQQVQVHVHIMVVSHIGYRIQNTKNHMMNV